MLPSVTQPPEQDNLKTKEFICLLGTVGFASSDYSEFAFIELYVLKNKKPDYLSPINSPVGVPLNTWSTLTIFDNFGNPADIDSKVFSPVALRPLVSQSLPLSVYIFTFGISICQIWRFVN
jgi:hypothetical protein